MGFLETVMRTLLASFRIGSAAGEDGDRDDAIDQLPYNPLLNTLILAIVFRNTNTRNELLRNRLVCKVWHKIATEELRTNHSVHRVLTHESDLKKLVLLTRWSPDLPITRFYIKIAKLDRCNDLFKMLSLPTIVSLKMVIESKHFEGALRTITTNMKSLRHLTISRIPEQSFEAMHVTTRTTEKLGPGHTLPKLTSLTFRNASPNRKNFLATFDSSVIDVIRAAENLARLEFFHWNSLTRVLRECPFTSLKTFRVIGGKLTETDLLVLTAKKSLSLDSVVARVDKTVRQEVLNQFLLVKVQGHHHHHHHHN